MLNHKFKIGSVVQSRKYEYKGVIQNVQHKGAWIHMSILWLDMPDKPTMTILLIERLDKYLILLSP